MPGKFFDGLGFWGNFFFVCTCTQLLIILIIGYYIDHLLVSSTTKGSESHEEVEIQCLAQGCVKNADACSMNLLTVSAACLFLH